MTRERCGDCSCGWTQESLPLNEGCRQLNQTSLFHKHLSEQFQIGMQKSLTPVVSQVRMRTLQGSELAVGFYPNFDYDSSGGGGIARAVRGEDNRLHLTFDPGAVSIPNVTSKSSEA